MRGDGVGRVWATRTREGHLKVVIETNDMGHAGEYGFACSDVPLKLVPLDASWSTVDAPGRLNIVGANAQIDEHWWAVLYNRGSRSPAPEDATGAAYSLWRYVSLSRSEAGRAASAHR